MSDSLLTADEVIAILRVSKKTLVRMRARGTISPVEFTPGRILFRKSDVEALINR